MTFTDVDANQHFARSLSPAFGVLNSVWLTNAELTHQALEDVVLSAYGKMKMSREQELRSGTGHALCVPTLFRAMGRSKLAGHVDGADAAGAGRTATRADNSSSNNGSSTPAVRVVAVEAERHKHGVLEAEGLAEGEAEEGMGAVVREQLGAGGHLFHRIPTRRRLRLFLVMTKPPPSGCEPDDGTRG